MFSTAFLLLAITASVIPIYSHVVTKFAENEHIE